MQRPEPSQMTISDILLEIKNGSLKVPQFQREFVWSIEKSAGLMDSILHNYPIGAFIIWKTKDKLRTIKEIGNLSFPDVPEGDFIYYVLDGQQRITSIFASLEGSEITRLDEKKEDFSKLYINLRATEDEKYVYTDLEGKNPDDFISIKKLFSEEIMPLVSQYSNLIDRIDFFRKRLNEYQFSRIELKDAPLDVATEIFARVNTNGKPLSAFEIMCAKMYDESSDFDLREKRNSQNEEWDSKGYGTVPDSTVLQAISACLVQSCQGKEILGLNKNDFIAIWDDVDIAFGKAIDYFKSAFGVAVSKLLPYDALLVPFVYYFYKHPNPPDSTQASYLQDYFWRCVLSTRFTEGMVSKIGQDVSNVISTILNDTQPKYEKGVDISFDTIVNKGAFSTGSAFAKGALCILCSKHPKTFNSSTTEVIIDNSWLSQGNSKNYHHFFPKAYMSRYQPQIEKGKVDHIANITIVDDFLNKRIIKAKAPSIYMKDFQDCNPLLNQTMKTHLIGDLTEFGVFNNNPEKRDNYLLFFEKRINLFREEFKTRLIITENDIIE